MSFRVYLAGPIGNCTYTDAVGWRHYVTEKLLDSGIAAYSPMRLKEFLEKRDNITWTNNKHLHPLMTSKGIMSRDYNDCVNADALLVNFLGATQPSMGTCMELAWAFERKIPVIVVAEPDNIHINHPMLLEATNFHVTSLDEGIELLKAVLLPAA